MFSVHTDSLIEIQNVINLIIFFTVGNIMQKQN